MSAEPMPVAIGFHPYFQLTDSPREEWRLQSARGPTGCSHRPKSRRARPRPIEQLFPDRGDIRLADYDLDHVFGDLVRDGSGRATMTVKGKQQGST